MGVSVGTAAAVIIAADFCAVPTDTLLLVDNWQPLLAAKQQIRLLAAGIVCLHCT